MAILLDGDQKIILLHCLISPQSYNHIPNKDASSDIFNRVFFRRPLYFHYMLL